MSNPRFIDLAGKRFGKLVAIEHDQGKWTCRCDCGTVKRIYSTNLRQGTVNSCGCLRRPVIEEEAGAVYGKLTVVRRADTKHRYGAEWVCECECGKLVTVLGVHLRNGRRASCVGRPSKRRQDAYLASFDDKGDDL